jgi:hypothetical protein
MADVLGRKIDRLMDRIYKLGDQEQHERLMFGRTAKQRRLSKAYMRGIRQLETLQHQYREREGMNRGRKLGKRAVGARSRKIYRAMKSTGDGSVKTAYYSRRSTARSRARHENPPKVRKGKTNRWIPAKAVKVVRKKGKLTVYVKR